MLGPFGVTTQTPAMGSMFSGSESVSCSVVSSSLQPHGLYSPPGSSVHGGSDGKESAFNAGDPGSILRSGRRPGEGNGYPLQYSCPENFMDSMFVFPQIHVLKSSPSGMVLGGWAFGRRLDQEGGGLMNGISALM